MGSGLGPAAVVRVVIGAEARDEPARGLVLVLIPGIAGILALISWLIPLIAVLVPRVELLAAAAGISVAARRQRRRGAPSRGFGLPLAPAP